ncbi:MAG: insulinase family protein [Pyrinomonadaceae bacterium]
MPGAGPASQLSLPVPKSFKLVNGLTVMLVERHNLPVVSANLVVLSGRRLTRPPSPDWLLSLRILSMKAQSAAPHYTLANDAAQIGATLATASTGDSSSVAVRALKKNVDAAFDLMADVALNPAFPQKEIDRVRSIRLTQILQQRDNPNALASVTL